MWWREVASGVLQVSLAWGMTYVLREGRRVMVIDTGLRKDRRDLRRALGEIGVRASDLEGVLLTHGHCDHAGNAAWLCGADFEGRGEGFRSRLYAHVREARYLEHPVLNYAPIGQHRLRRPFSAALFLLGERIHPVERCSVDTHLRDGDTIDAPGGVLRVVHSPGHTPGHISFFREADGLLFSGDAVLNLIPIRRATALSLPMHVFTENWEEAKRSARRLADLRPFMLLPGHGSARKHVSEDLVAWAKSL